MYMLYFYFVRCQCFLAMQIFDFKTIIIAVSCYDFKAVPQNDLKVKRGA